MIYLLEGAVVFLFLTSAIFAWLWRRSERWREEDKNEMIDYFVERKSSKISNRISEVLRFVDHRTGEEWLPKVVWKQDVDPYLVDFWVVDPEVCKANALDLALLEEEDAEGIIKAKLAEFSIDFHIPGDYPIYFRKEKPSHRENASNFHKMLRDYVEASSPWEIEKHAARIHKSKSPNKKHEESEALAAVAGQAN